MIADPFPIDQYYVAQPAELFESSLDDLVINVDNDVVLEGMGDECILISSAYLCG
jgi:DEAD/DEAH box helicase domain-containing protein